jgi:hypothetical protein
MFLASRPSPQTIERFVASSQGLSLSYGPPGILNTASVRRGLDEAIVAIGRGKGDFERAQNALRAFQDTPRHTSAPSSPCSFGTLGSGR